MARRGLWVIGGLAVGVGALVLVPDARTWLRRRLGLEAEDRRWFEDENGAARRARGRRAARHARGPLLPARASRGGGHRRAGARRGAGAARRSASAAGAAGLHAAPGTACLQPASSAAGLPAAPGAAGLHPASAPVAPAQPVAASPHEPRRASLVAAAARSGGAARTAAAARARLVAAAARSGGAARTGRRRPRPPGRRRRPLRRRRPRLRPQPQPPAYESVPAVAPEADPPGGAGRGHERDRAAASGRRGAPLPPVSGWEPPAAAPPLPPPDRTAPASDAAARAADGAAGRSARSAAVLERGRELPLGHRRRARARPRSGARSDAGRRRGRRAATQIAPNRAATSREAAANRGPPATSETIPQRRPSWRSPLDSCAYPLAALEVLHVKKLVTVLATVAVAVGLSAGPAGAKPQADPPGLKTPGAADRRAQHAGSRLPERQGRVRHEPRDERARAWRSTWPRRSPRSSGSRRSCYIQNNFQNMYLPGPKKWDFGFAEMTITAERKKNIDFSMPYINANQGVMIRKGLSPVPKSIADLKKLVALRADRHHGRRVHQGQDPAHQEGALPADDDDHVPAAQVEAAATPPSTTCRSSAPSASSSRRPYGPIVGQIITNEQYGVAFQKGEPICARRQQGDQEAARQRHRSASSRRSG